MDVSITNDIVSSEIYGKRNVFNYFEVVNIPSLDGDVVRFPSYGVYISHLVFFTRACFNVSDFNNRNQHLTVKAA